MKYIEIVVIDALDVDGRVFSTGFRVVGDDAFHTQVVAYEASRGSYGQHIGVFHQIVFEVSVQADDGYLFFIETELLVVEEVHLAVDEKGGYDEKTCGDELEYDEAFAEHGGG